MQMVWHEAVGNNCELLLVCSTQELLHNELDYVTIGKQIPPCIGAECQRLPVKTDVAETFQVTRSVRDHAPGDGNFHA
jgi:hypothetical protein